MASVLKSAGEFRRRVVVKSRMRRRFKIRQEIDANNFLNEVVLFAPFRGVDAGQPPQDIRDLSRSRPFTLTPRITEKNRQATSSTTFCFVHSGRSRTSSSMRSRRLNEACAVKSFGPHEVNFEDSPHDARQFCASTCHRGRKFRCAEQSPTQRSDWLSFGPRARVRSRVERTTNAQFSISFSAATTAVQQPATQPFAEKVNGRCGPAVTEFKSPLCSVRIRLYCSLSCNRC